MNIVNLTGHDVIVRTGNGDIKIPAKDPMFRVRYTTMQLGDLNTPYGSVPLTKNIYIRVKNPPPIVKETYYLVSRLVAELYPERDDFVITNGLIKEKGRAIACRSLGKI